VQKNDAGAAISPQCLLEQICYEEKCWNLVALAALTAEVGMPVSALAQEVDDLTEQCEYIWDIRGDRNALQRELDLLLGGSSNALSCRFDTPEELRNTCEEQCIGLIVSLLGDTPIAEIPGPVDPY
jgi:hypothetical protein